VIQSEVQQHHKNANDPQSSSQARYTIETRISEVSNNLVLGNHEASNEIEEISINYTSSGEVYDRITTIVNLCF
jgi:U3 small nucleolar RNA-associated protein 14